MFYWGQNRLSEEDAKEKDRRMGGMEEEDKCKKVGAE